MYEQMRRRQVGPLNGDIVDLPVRLLGKAFNAKATGSAFKCWQTPPEQIDAIWSAAQSETHITLCEGNQ